MYVLEDVKVFDMNNPNCVFRTKIEKVKDMIVDCPICRYKTFGGNEVIGIIKEPYIREENIFAKCYIYDDNNKIYGNLVNYTVEIENVKDNVCDIRDVVFIFMF